MLHSYSFLGGRQPYKILALHEKYGPVVRTSPDELSFSSVGSWKDIYGFRPGVRTFIKSGFYDGGSFADQAYSIVSERDPVTHGKMRKDLSHAFSDRSLKGQESLINEVIDELIVQLGIYASGEQGADIVMWFNLATFDIIGSLAFGESFGGLKSGVFGLGRIVKMDGAECGRQISFLDCTCHQSFAARRIGRYFESISAIWEARQALYAQSYRRFGSGYENS